MTTTNYSPLYIKHGIYERWHPYTWEDYDGDQYKSEVMQLVEEESNTNLILYGTPGTGKTMLLNIAFKDLMHRGNNVYIMDFRDLVGEYMKGFGRSEMLREYMDCDYLGIDDMGKEFSGSGMSKEIVVNVLDYVLRHRYHRNLPTWITSNISLKEISENYNEYIASLLKRSSVALAMTGEDYGNRLFKKIGKK